MAILGEKSDLIIYAIAGAVALAILGLSLLGGWWELRHEFRYKRELKARAAIRLDEFCEFYSAADAKEIARRLQPIYTKFCGIQAGKLRPEDRPPILTEIDNAPLVQIIEEVFGVTVTDQDAEGINGSFDSIVQFLVERRRDVDQTKV